jgi:hypothetical protein
LGGGARLGRIDTERGQWLTAAAAPSTAQPGVTATRRFRPRWQEPVARDPGAVAVTPACHPTRRRVGETLCQAVDGGLASVGGAVVDHPYQPGSHAAATPRRRPAKPAVERRGRYRQNPADPQIAVFAHERHDRRRVGSSSEAKKLRVGAATRRRPGSSVDVPT